MRDGWTLVESSKLWGVWRVSDRYQVCIYYSEMFFNHPLYWVVYEFSPAQSTYIKRYMPVFCIEDCLYILDNHEYPATNNEYEYWSNYEL